MEPFLLCSWSSVHRDSRYTLLCAQRFASLVTSSSLCKSSRERLLQRDLKRFITLLLHYNWDRDHMVNMTLNESSQISGKAICKPHTHFPFHNLLALKRPCGSPFTCVQNCINSVLPVPSLNNCMHQVQIVHRDSM